MTRLITIFDKNLNQRVFRLFDEDEIVHKIDTNLTISASSTSIDVGNNVELTGVLTDENSVPLGGMSIRILKNNVLVDTVTTNSSGVYSKIITGLDIGTYHFHASYAGNDVYDNALSSTIDVSVVGHTYVVTIASDKQTALVGDNVTISGTLTRDSVGYGGQSVRIFDDGVLLDTVTTDNNGDYTKTISNLTLGTHRYSSQFDAVESNIAVVEVNNHLYDIDITADNPIIESGDTATITATLTDNTIPVVGETLSYTVSHDSTTIDSGTLTTGSNGSASFSYNGTGVGDVTIEIDYSTLLQETYEIEDCHIYDSGLTDKSSNYVKSTGMSMTHSTDHYILSNTIENSFVNFVDGLDNVLFECDWSAQSDTYINGLICSDRQLEFYNDVALLRGFDVGKGWCITIKHDDVRYTNLNETVVAYSKDTYNKLQMSINGDTIINKVYSSDGTELYSITVSKSVSNKYLSAFLGQVNATAYIKNIKVKAL